MRRSALAVLATIALPCFAQNHNGARPVARPTYTNAVRSWHAPVPDRSAPVDDSGRTKLALVALNTQERVELPALSASGGFQARDLDRAAHLLREPSSGNEHPIEPRVLDAIYRIQTHFGAQEIRVISGYRTPAAIASARGSQHGRGRAIDVIVPGTSDDDVAKFARDMGYMGVGVYPASGFVHVDVRDRSYFWVDSSGPGGRTRERGILSDIAAKADREATARGEKGTPSVVIAADVDALLGGHVAPAAPVQEEDED
ncbi:MAG TPA: DUF882 domain-containing protein [Polyangiaceae bacterium]|jgi:uncharacterized protein YcbK (DUF882 family)|nr:DUF882 domain-containing protein [Polyangiaceae bacterium]